MFVGTLVSRCPALKYGRIHVHRFEKERTRALENNNSDATIILLSELNEEFAWWKAAYSYRLRTNMSPSTYDIIVNAPMNEPVYDLEIFSDASRTGWDVVYEVS